MGAFAATDSALAKSGRARLRAQGEAAMLRKTGPRLKKLGSLSRSARFARLAQRRRTQTIVAGAGPGRVGSTALVAHLQREGFSVSHESGNTRSADHDPVANSQDVFTLRAQPEAKRLVVARAKVQEWLDRALGEKVVGDVGLANSQIMRELLLADPRVVLVVQVRDEDAYARSATTITTKQARWETNLFLARGITAATYPQKTDRLKEYMRQIQVEAGKLKTEFGPARVQILPLNQLQRKGSGLLKRLGANNHQWDPALGRNASEGASEGRFVARLRQKGQVKKRPAVAGADAQRNVKKRSAAA